MCSEHFSASDGNMFYCEQGGASLQFSAIPLNLTAKGDTIDYVVTGTWSKKAIAEGEKFCNANLAAKACINFPCYALGVLWGVSDCTDRCIVLCQFFREAPVVKDAQLLQPTAT